MPSEVCSESVSGWPPRVVGPPSSFGKGGIWVVGGYYTDTVVRTADGWKIRHLVLTKTWETGDPGIRKRAHARAAASRH